MTIAANKSAAPVSPVADAPARVGSIDEAHHDRRIWLVTVAIVAAMFLALENPFWVPGGDSEVYIASARNIALGNGYMFNGQAARIAPPGWPMVLAFMMKFISPTFLSLKLVTLTCMLGALATFYWVIRRFASPMLSAAIIVLTALISHVYSLTYWLHSDALFTLITALSLLLALQISADDRRTWKIIALLVICVISAAVRYAGIINILIISAALLQGHRRAPDRAWITVALAISVTIISFYSVRWAVNYFAPKPVAFENLAQIDPNAVLNDIQSIEGATSPEGNMPGTITRGRTGYLTRLLGYGTWFSYLLWQPLRLGTGSQVIWYIATALGWIVALLGLVATVNAIKKYQWLFPAVALYTLALCLNWPQATARYLVPLTPLILLMVVRGLKLVQVNASKPSHRVMWKTIGAVGLGSVVLCNGVLYAEEVRIMRSSHFADRYEAGLNKSLVAAAQYLSSKNVGNWQTAVNPEYLNINKRRMSPTGLRILTMLTGKAALQVPEKYTRAPYKIPNDRDFRRQFIAKHRVAFYLAQPKISPWRVSHYRMAWLQKWLTGEEPEEIEAGWRLYQCDGASTPIQVPLPSDVEFPKRVPGL